MSVTVRAAVRIAALAVVATSLVACGSDETTTASDGASTASPTESSATESVSTQPAEPDCATTWQDGAELPRTYDGCVDESGELVPADKIGCSSGQALLTYDDTWWGVAGGTVHQGTSPLTDDDGFMAAVRRCRA